MLQSELCILHGLNPSVRFNMGECRNDYGGYFIIDGKEKFIIAQEKFADNMLYIREYEDKTELKKFSYNSILVIRRKSPY
jgi:DNA-directed RNA polymerase beta subunit